MKCPKCNYVSHDYLDACRKCGIDLVTFKQEIGLLVLQPGVLDLSLVLGGAGADDFFESVEEEVTMHASDDDFDISLDDYAEHPGIRRTPHYGRPEVETDRVGLDHLTLELDASDMPADMTARLREARGISDEPPTVPTPPPAGPEVTTLPGHVTLEMASQSIASEFPTSLLQNIVPAAPPPQEVTEPLARPDAPSLRLDLSHVDLPRLVSADTPEAERVDEAGAVSLDEAVSIADSSGALTSLPLQDVTLAADTPIALVEPDPEVVEPTLPTVELLDAMIASGQTDAIGPSAPAETEEATGLPPSLELDLSTLAEAEATLSELTVSTPDEASFLLTEEAIQHPPSVSAWTPTAAETPAEGLLTPSDMLALENLEDPMPPEHLTLDLEPPALPVALASSILEDATPLPLPTTPDILETLTSAGPEPGLPLGEALIFEDLDDIDLPGHLTLELDGSETASEVSSIILDSLQLDNPPGAPQSAVSPRDTQADDEEELLLDLDSLELDDDDSA